AVLPVPPLVGPGGFSAREVCEHPARFPCAAVASRRGPPVPAELGPRVAFSGRQGEGSVGPVCAVFLEARRPGRPVAWPACPKVSAGWPVRRYPGARLRSVRLRISAGGHHRSACGVRLPAPSPGHPVPRAVLPTPVRFLLALALPVVPRRPVCACGRGPSWPP